MSASNIFDYLLLLLAPIITYLFSKIKVFAPRSQSTYVVVNDTSNQPAGLLISTRYLEIYADRNLAAAFLIILSILSILHLLYFIYAFRQPLMPFKVLWKAELDAHTYPKDAGTVGKSKTTWRVFNMLPNQLPEHHIYDSSLIRSASGASNASEQGDIGLKELSMPQPAQVRDTTPLRFQRGTYERRHKPKEDDDDWKTVYCKEWDDNSDRESVTSLGAGVHLRRYRRI